MPKKLTKFVALLRGINVGGKNIIAKDDLKQCFADLGYQNVTTYIQSGNILFHAPTSSVKTVTAQTEKQLADRFSYHARAVVLTDRQYAEALELAHPDWGHKTGQKHNALFTLSDTNAKKVLSELPDPLSKYETVSAAKNVIFWSASQKDLSRTTMMKLGKTKIYKQLTVRNHNTTFKILELFENLGK